MLEILISLFFLRPAVDAYRISTNHEDDGASFDQLMELVCNKCIELTCESIPGCVLQLYAFIKNPNEAGTYSLVSIFICVLTTGYASTLIAFDYDADVTRRQSQPKFYGTQSAMRASE